jgi:hypothetical protein
VTRRAGVSEKCPDSAAFVPVDLLLFGEQEGSKNSKNPGIFTDIVSVSTFTRSIINE